MSRDNIRTLTKCCQTLCSGNGGGPKISGFRGEAKSERLFLHASDRKLFNMTESDLWKNDIQELEAAGFSKVKTLNNSSVEIIVSDAEEKRTDVKLIVRPPGQRRKSTLTLANASTKWTSISLGNVERELEATLPSILASSKTGHILVPLARATQDRMKLLMKEDMGMYSKLEATAKESGATSARVRLYDDVMRHIVWIAGKRTDLAGRIGLTCKTWYPAVWKHQQIFHVTSIRAMLSLSKRKAIDPSIIRSINIDLREDTKNVKLDASFANKFLLLGAASSLRSLRIHDGKTTSSQLFVDSQVSKMSPLLEDIEYVCMPKVWDGPWSLIRELPKAPFSHGLKRLILDFGSKVSGRGQSVMPLDIAKACTNLEEFGILWLRPDGDGPSDQDLVSIQKHLPNLKRLIVPNGIACLDLQTLKTSYGAEEGTIKIGAAALLEAGKNWVQGVIQRVGLPVARVICTPLASVFELAIQCAYSAEMFQYCYDLGLPLSLCGHHSATACFLAGPFPKCLGWQHLFLKDTPNPKKVMEFLKKFFKSHGDEIDFEATTVRASSKENGWTEPSYSSAADPAVPDLYASVNLFQSAIISANLEFLTFITRQMKEFFADQIKITDIVLAPSGRFNPFVSVFVNHIEASKAMECLRNVFSHPDLSKLAKVWLNEPDVFGHYPARYMVEFIPELFSIVKSDAVFNYERIVSVDLVPECRQQIKGILLTKGWTPRFRLGSSYVAEKDKRWHGNDIDRVWAFVSK